MLNFQDGTLGESESGRDLSLLLHLPFDPGNFLGCEGWIVVVCSTCLSQISICVVWTLLSIKSPTPDGDSFCLLLCNIFTKFLMIKMKDVWLYLKCVPPWHIDVVYCANSNPHVMRIWCLFVLSFFLQGFDSRTNPFQEGEDDRAKWTTYILMTSLEANTQRLKTWSPRVYKNKHGEPILSMPLSKVMCERLL